MKKKLTFLTSLVVFVSAFAFDIKLDGKLDEAQWNAAKEHADFRPYKSGNANLVMPKTSFKIINDDSNLYLGIYCKEPEMQKLIAPKKLFPWGSDLVEIFMSPSCRQDEFYQFVVSAANVRWCEYYGESGNIRPDPGYAPLWDSAVYKGKDFWSIEIRIPLAGFYNTRNSQWQTTWLFNITRDRKPGGANSATWSPLVNRNQDSFLFRKLSGFPIRQAKDDFFIQNITFDAASKKANKYSGDMKLNIFSGVDGIQNLHYNNSNCKIKLRKGWNKINIPYHFANIGKQNVTLRINNGNTIGRTYPVAVKYDPIKIILTTPSYSNTFYPGQNKSKVEGFIQYTSPEKVTLVFEGDGIKTQKIILKNKDKFSFKSSAIGEKGATLTATMKSEKIQIKINAPAPTKNRMAWLENGRLVINGKRVFGRSIDGIGNYTGRKFNAMFEKDRAGFNINNDLFRHITIEPRIMVKGIESEAILDKVPSKILFDRIAQRIQQFKNTDFTFYYLNDEPECRNISPIYLEHLYKFVKSLDPYHPVKICTREPLRYVNCADYISMHPYWGPYFDANGNRVHTTEMATIPPMFKGWQSASKASGLTPQVFSYRNFWNRVAAFPTLDEMESSIWASIICGAAGIGAYHYHDLGDRAELYEGMRFIMTSLARLDDFILSDDRKVLASPEDTLAAVFTANGKKLLIFVNLSNKNVKMTAPFNNMKEFCGKKIFNGQITLKPFQTVLYTSTKMDHDLKTKAEVITEIEKQEKARLAAKNIFLEKGFDINVTFSGFNHFNPRDWAQSKLFDGNFNIMGWGNTQFRNSWMELGFAKFTPEFTRLILHGFNMKKVTIKYWKNGKWNDLKEVSSAKYSQYKAEFICNSSIRTVKLRLEFPQNDLPYELYEIEAYNDGKNSNQTAFSKQAGPDPLKAKENILWRQDGKNIILGPKGWKSKYLKIYANKDGDFTIAGNIQGKGISPSADTYIPISKDYPWIVFRLKSAKDLPGNKYRAWCIQGPKMGNFFQDVSPIPGIYAVNMNEKQDLGKTKLSYIVVYSYNHELVFEDISIVKKMECMVSSKFIKDGISVTVQLQNPAENVSVRVCHRFKPLTGELNLKPADKDCLIWKGIFKFDKPLQNRKMTVFPAGQLDLRTDVLGGTVPVPVFTKIFQHYPVK